jgi:hypothetical protein
MVKLEKTRLMKRMKQVTWMMGLMVVLASGPGVPASAQVTTAARSYALPAAGLPWPAGSIRGKVPDVSFPASFEEGLKFPAATPSSMQRAAQQPARIPPDAYYVHCYGLFCKLEWMTQQKLHIPLSFRLGDAAYEERLERGD